MEKEEIKKGKFSIEKKILEDRIQFTFILNNRGFCFPEKSFKKAIQTVTRKLILEEDEENLRNLIKLLK